MSEHAAHAMPILRNPQALAAVAPNIGSLVLDNAARHDGAPAFAERVDGRYASHSWRQFGADLLRVAAWLGQRERVAFVAGNSYLRHVAELATMAAGGASVPVFAGYPAATARSSRSTRARLAASGSRASTAPMRSIRPPPAR